MDNASGIAVLIDIAREPRWRKVLNGISGSVLVVLGLRLLFVKPSSAK